MFNVLNMRKCGPIGLDIGSEGIRMLQLSGSGKRMRVSGAARWHFPPGAAGPDADPRDRRQAAVSAVRDLLKDGAFIGRQVVGCLRADEVQIKNVRLPHMSQTELTSAAVWECQERFGFKVAPDRLHFINAGEVRQGTEVRDEVVLMAVPEEVIQDYLEMLAEMRLTPVHIDTEPTALFRTYQRFLRRAEDESMVSVVVDIGLRTTKVIVARGATPVLIKCIDIGGHKLNEGVSRELNLSHAEAMQVRRTALGTDGTANGKSPNAQDVRWSVLDAIRGPLEALAGEIAMCLRYCSVTFRGLRPDRVTVCGGETYDPALMKLLAENLDCQCAIGEPLRGIDLGEADMGSDRRSLLSEWSVATGLALRDQAEGEHVRESQHERSRVPA